MYIIGIAGPARAGKTTITDALLIRLICQDNWLSYAFADPIKAMITAMGIDDPDYYKTVKHPIFGVTTREMYQTLGTEWAQQLMGKDVWIKAMQAKIPHDSNVIVSDVRFPHEAAFVRDNGLLIHVQGRGGINSTHTSENPLSVTKQDLVIDNSGSWQRTLNQVDNITEIVLSDSRILRSSGL